MPVALETMSDVAKWRTSTFIEDDFTKDKIAAMFEPIREYRDLFRF